MKLLARTYMSMWVTSVLFACSLFAEGQGSAFNTPGNILIADQFNNRVIEVNPKTGAIVWSFGDGSSEPGPHSIVATNDAQRIGDLTLIAGTGAPAGTPTIYEANCFKNGCPDNRVIVVNQAGKIVWQYGEGGVAGSGPNQLNTPVQTTFLPNKNILVTDQGNQRVVEINQQKHIVWQYGKTGKTGLGPNELNNPNSAELLENGDILIADENNNRVIEVSRKRQIVWQYAPNDPNLLNGAAFASRLCNGHTLITDSNNNRVIEITSTGSVVFTYVTNTRTGSVKSPLPTRAIRMCDGRTLISDQYNNQVIEIDRKGDILFSYGQIGVIGNGPNQLDAPYDAKEIGDYVGITPPFGSFFGKH
jgi:outer membrane protein assembly factor BamB